MIRCHRPRSRSIPTSGFTLIELVTVVTIVIILAGVVVPRVSGFSDKAKFAKAASDLKSMKRALEYMYQDVGYFPADQSRGVDPGLNDISRVPSAQQGDWRGPYLEAWPELTPWNGRYDYEYRNEVALNFDGVAGNEVLISIRENIDQEIATRIDEILDDGDSTTGMLRYSSSAVYFYIG
ncbi:MAG: type II secretion system protein GspG, partial [Planctomycetota bacterium]